MVEDRLTLTIGEVAQVLGISRSLAYEMARQKKIPVLKFGRRLLVPRCALLRLLEEGGSEGAKNA